MAAPIDSDVAVCNSFLTRIGANQINSLTDQSKEAQTLKANFEFLRDDVNAAHAWGFALKQAEPAQDGGSPIFGAANQFAIPDDLLGFITEQSEIQGIDAPYRIMGDFIVTNSTSIRFEYVARITDLNKWHIMARETFVARLMAELTPALTGRFNAVQGLYNVYNEKLAMAGAYNGAESTPREFIVDTLLNARNGGYGVGSKVSDF